MSSLSLPACPLSGPELITLITQPPTLLKMLLHKSERCQGMVKSGPGLGPLSDAGGMGACPWGLEVKGRCRQAQIVLPRSSILHDPTPCQSLQQCTFSVVTR